MTDDTQNLAPDTQDLAPRPVRAHRKRALTAGAVAACLAVGSIGIGALSTLSTTIRDNSAELTTSEVVHPVLEMTLTGSPFALAVGPDGATGTGTSTWLMRNTGELDASWDGIFQLRTDADLSPEVAAATRVIASRTVTVEGLYGQESVLVEFDLGTLAEPVSLGEAVAIGATGGEWQVRGTLGSLQVVNPGHGGGWRTLGNPLRDQAPGAVFEFDVRPTISADDRAAVEAAVDPDGAGGVTVRAVADFVGTYMQAG